MQVMSETLPSQTKMRQSNSRINNRPPVRNINDNSSYFQERQIHPAIVSNSYDKGNTARHYNNPDHFSHHYSTSTNAYRPRGYTRSNEYNYGSGHDSSNSCRLQDFLVKRWKTFESEFYPNYSSENNLQFATDDVHRSNHARKYSSSQWERGLVNKRQPGSNTSSPLESPSIISPNNTSSASIPTSTGTILSPSKHSSPLSKFASSKPQTNIDEEASSVSSNSSSLRRQPNLSSTEGSAIMKKDTHKATPEKHWTHQEVEHITHQTESMDVSSNKTQSIVSKNSTASFGNLSFSETVAVEMDLTRSHKKTTKRHQSASSTSLVVLPSNGGNQERDSEFYTPNAPSPSNLVEEGPASRSISKDNSSRNRIRVSSCESSAEQLQPEGLRSAQSVKETGQVTSEYQSPLDSPSPLREDSINEVD